MDIIEEFVARYRREYDFYSHAAHLVAQRLDADLQAAGIRCIVTDRAKSVGRLEAKCRQRAAKAGYVDIDDIYNDIVDLAGVRVALYFPAERDQVEHLIQRTFVLTEDPKRFPAAEDEALAPRRFSGYSAVHFRVRINEGDLGEADSRYAEARVEIQVASVLMHAWSEVEHDLVYKPLAGELSSDEHNMLDQLNGLVIAGEIALEALQKAGEARVAEGGRRFTNHYDLAGHLLATATVLDGPVNESGMGRVDDLFDLLARLHLDTPDMLKPYVEALHGDIEVRPVAEQIIDQVLAEDENRYKVYEAVRLVRRGAPADREGAELEPSIGLFLSEWIRLERLAREVLGDPKDSQRAFPISRLTRDRELLDGEMALEFSQLQGFRNRLVHGLEAPDAAELTQTTERLKVLVDRIEQRVRRPSAEPTSAGEEGARSSSMSSEGSQR